MGVGGSKYGTKKTYQEILSNNHLDQDINIANSNHIPRSDPNNECYSSNRQYEFDPACGPASVVHCPHHGYPKILEILCTRLVARNKMVSGDEHTAINSQHLPAVALNVMQRLIGPSQPVL
jgi:hypothetical protein